MSNENLETIEADLRPRLRYHIQTMCSSDDQAFTLLAYGAKVTAVTSNPQCCTWH